ncbi:MAG: MaoC/PaaZ C-terminal domain-containing protein, partial [Acidimicrobiales bacterium]
AHTYTESARIWNPIHTDSKVAHSAGLPGIILHGTATLALGVSAVIKHVAHGEPERVRRIRGRMASMVLMPSTISVQILDSTPIADNTQMAVRFQVLTEDGQIAISAGLVIIDNVNV